VYENYEMYERPAVSQIDVGEDGVREYDACPVCQRFADGLTLRVNRKIKQGKSNESEEYKTETNRKGDGKGNTTGKRKDNNRKNRGGTDGNKKEFESRVWWRRDRRGANSAFVVLHALHPLFS